MTLRWTTLLVRGLVGVAFGVLAMAWPDETVLVLVVLWGCWALVDGLMILGVRPGSRRAPAPRSSRSCRRSWRCWSLSSRS